MWVVSELWCGGIPTSYSDPSTPRISLLIVTLLNQPFRPTFSFYRFLDCSFPPFFLSPTNPEPFIIKNLLFVTAPRLLSLCKAPPTWMSPAPATRQPLPLIPAHRAKCLCMPPFPGMVRSSFSALGLHPDPCHLLGGSPVQGSSAPLFPCIALLSSPPNSGIVWSLVSCWVDFCARARDQGASTPW